MEATHATRTPWPRIVFDLLVLGLVGLLVVRALDLRPAAMLIPLMVGVPVLVGFGFQLLRDLGRLQRRETSPEPGSDADAESMGAQTLAFVLLIVGWVVLGAMTSLLVAFPVALLAILLVSRVAPLLAVAITLAMWGVAFVIFDIALGVTF